MYGRDTIALDVYEERDQLEFVDTIDFAMEPQTGDTFDGPDGDRWRVDLRHFCKDGNVYVVASRAPQF